MGQQKGLCAKARRSRCGLAARMATADDDDVPGRCRQRGLNGAHGFDHVG